MSLILLQSSPHSYNVWWKSLENF